MVAVAGAYGQPASLETRFQEYLAAQRTVNQFSGSVLVVKSGQVVLRTGVGLANREWEMANTADTKFRLGSITKQFTATAVMLLEQDGKLQVEDSIDKHIADAPEAWKKVTIHHLLSHTSGIPSYTSDPTYGREMYKPYPLPELIGRFRGKALEFEPGEKWNYSNSGYVLLGAIIERASGMTYAEFLQKRIFGPLGMRNSGYDSWAAILMKRASGYSKGPGGSIVNAAYLDMSQPHAAGSLYSTVDDLLLWHKALLGEKVLPKAVLERMFTAVKNNYGYGWATGTVDGKAMQSHGGGINGFATFIGRIPSDDSLVVVLSNLQSANSQAVALDLMQLADGKTVDLPKIRKEISLSNDVFDAYVGKYEITPTFHLRVFRDGGRFLTQATGQGQIEIFPESETKFFVKVMEAQLEFVKDADGKVTQLILYQGGRKTPGKKVE
jgi:CubicO group peptidase (beta-lactamase class C family)